MKNNEITLEQAARVLEVVDAGLCSGLGNPKPGEMCVEAAVCYALGQEHGDEPACVAKSVRSFKIRLNDSPWSSKAARAKGMRKIAIAQLGTRDAIDEKLFAQTVAKLTIQRIVPIALRAAASVKVNAQFKEELEAAAIECEQTGASGSATKARSVAKKAYAYAAAAAAAAAAADDADAYAYADAYAAAADAYAAAADAYAAKRERRDSVLCICAEIGVEALRICGAAGVVLMDKLIK